MKLCFISNPNFTHTRRWVNWFASHGHDVTLIGDSPLRQPRPDGRFYNLAVGFQPPAIKYLSWIIRARQILAAIKPDILHAHRVTGAGWIGAFSGYHPLVVTPWGTDIYQYPYRSPLARWLTNRVIQAADLITADSNDLLRQALRFGARPEAAHMIGWGVDLNLFHPGPASPILLEKLDIHSEPVVLSPRGLAPIYRIDIVVDAFAQLLSSYNQAVLILRDYNSTPGYKEQIQAHARELGVEHAIRWVAAFEPWEDNADLYRLASIVVSVPTTDGTPVSVLEAMASGIPVVASDLPSLREWITPGENGELASVGDARATARAILNILGSASKQAQYKQNSLEIIKTRANHQAEMEKMEQLYTDLCQKF